SADLQQYAGDFPTLNMKVIGPFESCPIAAAAGYRPSHHDRHGQTQTFESNHAAVESDDYRQVNAGTQRADPGTTATSSPTALVLSHDDPAADTLLNLAHGL